MGSVAMSAHIVVIMIGRKRSRQPSWIASKGVFAVIALRDDGEVNHHDRVFLHDADEHDEADEAVDVQVNPENHQRQQRAESRRRQAGQNRERRMKLL